MLETFDIFAYFDERNVEYTTEGKNVSAGWVNIQCFNPACDDDSNHLGINLKSKLIHCWRCGMKGSAVRIIQHVEKCSYTRAEHLLKEFQEDTLENLKRDIRIRADDCKLPEEALPDPPDLHRDYLIGRNFDPVYLTKKFSLKYCAHLGPYKFRIIAPIFLNGRLVNFQTRDVTGKAEKRYVICPNDKAIIPGRECLYNIDTVTDQVILVEGITDVWRLGDESVALMGIEYTREQLNLLIKKNLKEAYVLFDSEVLAQKRAEKLARELAGFVKKVEVITLPENSDPANLSDSDALLLKKKLLQK